MKVANTTLLFFRVGSSPFGFILPARRQRFLHTSQLCEFCPGALVAEINQSDSCIFPYEIRGMLDFLRWYFGSLPLALSCFSHAITVHPPSGGIWLLHHHGFVVTVDRYGDDSVHGGPLTS